MTVKNRKLFEKYKKERAHYVAFREAYTDRQVFFACWISFLMLVFSMVALVLAGRIFYFHESDILIFTALMVISAFIFIISLLTYFNIFTKDKKKKAVFFEYVIVLGVLIYLAWSFAHVVYIYMYSGKIEFLPVCMVFAASVIFLYHSLVHYFLYFTFCCVGLYWIVVVLKKGDYNGTTVVNVVIFGLILLTGGVIKYVLGVREFIADTEADNLSKHLEESNEDLRHANENLKHISETLEKRNEAQKLFTASLSHELRSPLNGVIGLLQVLLEDGKLEKEERETVEKAFSSSETLIQIVNDMLDYSKLEAGEFSIVYASFDMRRVMKNIMATSNPMAEKKGLALEYDIDAEMPCMYEGDSIRIQQIFQNIISNGIKYTDKGSVKVKMRYMDDDLLFSVTDTGIGISEKAMENLFDPFKRFDEKRNRFIQGTGLGLSIVKKLLDQMDASIEIDSKLGQGTSVFIRIPLKVNDLAIRYKDEFALEKETPGDVAPDLAGKKIMCIDDNKVNLSVFKGLLKSTNAEVTLSTGGMSGIEKAREEKFDIIFVDYMMPDMDGIETFERLRSEGLNTGTPIIMLTANAGAEAESMYRRKGFDGYLAKPVLKDKLYAIIRETLQNPGLMLW
jgi:signal transduction histidine kinase/ActR/RegA family two-component response regulator